MKASEVIKALQEAIDTHGDLPCIGIGWNRDYVLIEGVHLEEAPLGRQDAPLGPSIMIDVEE